MFKKLLSITLMLVAYIAASAQAPQGTPLPLNPNVKSGTLPNGMQYFVLHNEEPKGRANFYIAQKVGSTLETPQQLGLAHFLEHMAFNGSKNFPGKAMLNYLQNKGIRFGADINAYTAFDETVYNINNVPTSDVALMDSVLLVLHDWSGSLLLEDAEIDAERGVIQEEWRGRNDANVRMLTSILPQLYEEYQYTRMPIGTMEVVLNFPYKDLRDYYEKWYRPDQQGVVIVGDFDAAEMEQKIKNLFSSIPMPENAAERVYPHVSDNKELIYAPFEDPEFQVTMAQIFFKFDKTPFELRNTLEDYVEKTVFENLTAQMINVRLNEMSQKPDCPFAMASLSFGDYLVAKTKGAISLVVIAKTDIQSAMQAALAEVARSCKTGFTDSELQRAKDEMLSHYEKMYNERNKTNTEALAQELIRHFIDNEPAPGIEGEYQLLQQLLPMLPVQAFNEMAAQMLTADNEAVVIAQPKAEGFTLPAKEEVEAIINGALNAEYEAYVDEVITDPLIAKMPKPGKIKSKTEVPSIGATEYTLSNGVKVLVKPTTFAEDQVLVGAIRPGGKAQYKGQFANELAFVDEAVEVSKIGVFDQNKLNKYLAGKNVSTNYSTNMYSNRLDGASGKKDLEDMMQLIYATFTNLQPDADAYSALRQQTVSVLANADKNPNKIFNKAVSETWYANAPYATPLDAQMVEAADYNKMLSIAKETLGNAADYTFIVVGNVEPATLEPLLAQYVATLPANAKKLTPKSDYKMLQPTGHVVNEFEQPMESAIVNVFDVISGSNIPYTAANSIMLDLTGSILRTIYTETLREEEGGTYSPYAGAQFNPTTGQWSILYTYSTGADKKETINKRAIDEAMKLFKEGTDDEHFNKAKEAAVNQLKINREKNGYWMSTLSNYALGQSIYEGYAEALNALTLADLNAFMKQLVNDNRIEVIMDGVETAK